MRRLFSQAGFAVAFAFLASGSGHASDSGSLSEGIQVASVMPGLRPGWSRSSLERQANQSFLGDTVSVSTETALRDEIMTPRMASEIRQQYEDMSRNYELRAAYGLTDLEEQRSHVGRVKDFTRNVLSQVRAYHVKENMERLREASERNENLKQLAKPLSVVATAAAIYSGKPVSLRLSERSALSAATDVPHDRASLALTSPLINTSVDFMTRGQRDPNSDPLNPVPVEEAYRLSVSRSLPVLDLHSGVSYAGTTGAMTTSLSKQLAPHLSGSVSSTRQRAGNAEGTLSLLYQMQF